MGTIKRLQAFVSRLLTPRTTPYVDGRLVNSDAGAIHDGVSYDLPVIVTEPMRQHLGDRLQEYVENVAQTFRHQFDTPQRSAADMPIAPVTEDPLAEWSFATRKQVLSNCHAAYARNPIANRAVKYMAAFVVGQGFNLTCKNKQVEELLQAFIDNPDNQIRKYERQAARDLLVDGELILRFYKGKDATAGQLVVAPQRPWELEYIVTEKGFFRRPQKYHFSRYLTEGDAPTAGETDTDDVNADDILMVAINSHAYELRGRPELYSVLAWLRAYKEWLENRARQNHWRNALLWLVRVANATPASIAALVNRYSRPPTPGSVAVESDKVEIEPLSNPVGASDAGEDGRQIKIMAAVGLGLPEYFLGDGQNANLASSKSQQLPALMTFADYQRLLVEELWIPLFKRVIQNAIENSNLPAEVDEQDADGDTVHEDAKDDAERETVTTEAFPPANGNGASGKPALPIANTPKLPDEKPQQVKRIATLDAFAIEYEPIEDSEPFTLAQSLQIAVDNEWVSNETASTEMGFDYAIEQKKIKSERENNLRDVAAGLKPPAPGTIPPGYEGANEDEKEMAA